MSLSWDSTNMSWRFFLEGLNLTCHVFSCRWLLFQPCSIWEWKKNHGKHACRGLRRGEMWGHGAGTPESEKSTDPNKAIEKGHHPVSWIFLGLCYNLQEPILFFGFADFRLLCMRVGNVHITFFLFLDKTRLHVQTFLPRRWIPSHCSDFCGSEPSAIRGVLHRRVYSAVLVNRAPVCRPFCYHATI